MSMAPHENKKHYDVTSDRYCRKIVYVWDLFVKDNYCVELLHIYSNCYTCLYGSNQHAGNTPLSRTAINDNSLDDGLSASV